MSTEDRRIVCWCSKSTTRSSIDINIFFSHRYAKFHMTMLLYMLDLLYARFHICGIYTAIYTTISYIRNMYYQFQHCKDLLMELNFCLFILKILNDSTRLFVCRSYSLHVLIGNFMIYDIFISSTIPVRSFELLFRSLNIRLIILKLLYVLKS